jgi:hypothetical protein
VWSLVQSCCCTGKMQARRAVAGGKCKHASSPPVDRPCGPLGCILTRAPSARSPPGPSGRSRVLQAGCRRPCAHTAPKLAARSPPRASTLLRNRVALPRASCRAGAGGGGGGPRGSRRACTLARTSAKTRAPAAGGRRKRSPRRRRLTGGCGVRRAAMAGMTCMLGALFPAGPRCWVGAGLRGLCPCVSAFSLLATMCYMTEVWCNGAQQGSELDGG